MFWLTEKAGKFYQYIENLIQMDSSVKQQALALVNEINARCQVDVEGLTFEDLATKDWYLHILGVLCDYLGDELSALQEETDEAKAINQILKLINELDEFAEDVTEEIDGDAVAAGNPQQIFYMVQVIAALVDAAVKENELGEEESDGEQEDQDTTVAKKQTKQKVHERQKKSHSHQGKLNRSAQGINQEFQRSEGQSQSQESEELMVQYRLKDSNYPQMVESIPNAEFEIEDSPQKQKVMPFTFQNHNEISNPLQQSPQYLEQKMSETKMLNKKRNTANKSLKKNPEKNELLLGQKKPKKLITHPKTPQTLKRAKSQEEIVLTRKAQQQIKKTQKKAANIKNKNDLLKRAQSPVDQQLKRKGKELQYFMNQRATQKKQMTALKKKRKSYAQKNQKHLMKILNWRDEQMKKQRQQYQESMKMKVQLQKEQYVKQMQQIKLFQQ